MPATEETCRNQTTLHLIFAISGLVLLLSTIWMFAADHWRPWKVTQRKGERVDRLLTGWRQAQFETEQVIGEHERLADVLLKSQLAPPPGSLLDRFQQIVHDYQTVDGIRSMENFDFTDIDRKYSEFSSQANSARQLMDTLDQPQVAAGSETSDEVQSTDVPSDPTTDGDGVQAPVESAVALALKIRRDLFEDLHAIVKNAKVQEDSTLQGRKFAAADYDAAKADLGLGHRDARSSQVMKALQDKVDAAAEELANRSAIYDNISEYRKELQELVGQMTASVDEAQKEVDVIASELDRLRELVEERTTTYFTVSFPWLGKKWLELPVLDAFNSPREIEQIWLPELTQENGSFPRVARFDRCITCHQAIDESRQEDPNKPSFLSSQLITLTMSAPQEKPQIRQDENGQDDLAGTLQAIYGIRLAEPGQGLIDSNDVTVSFVEPNSAGALAKAFTDRQPDESGLALRLAMNQTQPAAGPKHENGLQVGDVVLYINGARVKQNHDISRFLLHTVKAGQLLSIQVHRGLPNPFSSHPRLDLFVGPSSPHSLQGMGCTICHEGQGSGTDFKWASHTPDSLNQRTDWSRMHGWFNNHHWIFPMNPKRFVESSCLKCHHEVAELEPSSRYPDPPAPKLMAGVRLIEIYGCFGCHEINGYDGKDRIGPDIRLEPNYFAAALQMKHEVDGLREQAARVEIELGNKHQQHEEIQRQIDAGSENAELLHNQLASVDQQIEPLQDRLDQLNNGVENLFEIRDLAGQITTAPDGTDAQRQRLLDLVTQDAQRSSEEMLLPAAAHKLTQVLKKVATPGKLRKVGPSLRHVAEKLDPEFLYDWIKEPKHFRPDTKMPQFFGHFKHLHDPHDRQLAERYEPIEILGITTYLLERSQLFDPIEPPGEMNQSSAEEKIARGKILFEFRGCLACHSHADFPQAHQGHGDSLVSHVVHGPDLSRIADKLSELRNAKGASWLYSWLRNPKFYHQRTRMPDVQLTPITADDGTQTDPAEDIVTYLLSRKTGWEPEAQLELDEQGQAALDDLVLERLTKTFARFKAQEYLASDNGIPEQLRSRIKGAEIELVGAAGQKQKLLYVGVKSIAKYGCYGCHDIPGFEDAKPIGTGLADWGRKDPSKLDFGHILHYLQGHGGHQHDGHDTGQNSETHVHDGDHLENDHHVGDQDYDHADGDHHEHDDQVETGLDPYLVEDITHHGRAGFAMQKLREPRSYDVDKITNKAYDDRLRMPLFPFTDEQREAIVTVLLGLVAEPPAPQYVYQPDRRNEAIVAGRKVLQKYNCGGCHLLEAEKWKVAYTATDFPAPPTVESFPFLQRKDSASRLNDSLKTDSGGLMHATLVGLSAVNDQDAMPVVLDDEGDEVEEDGEYNAADVRYRFNLWKPAILNGHRYDVGIVPLEIAAETIEKRYPAQGGNLTSLLLPRAVQLEKTVNPNAKGTEARGWLPPPLMGEGRKVQAEWLHDFLLDPFPIRPAVLLRMPKFNMSSAEAAVLVDYFAAVDDAAYPYDFSRRTRSDHLASEESEFRKTLEEAGTAEIPYENARFEHAMKIVTDQNYCIKCHSVGDFEPKGSDRAKAPNLSLVYKRLRSQFVRDWLANPKAILPYSSMPVNIPYKASEPHMGGVSQELFAGNSIQQLDGVVDLLMNFDRYATDHRKIKELVNELPPETATTSAGGGGPGE